MCLSYHSILAQTQTAPIQEGVSSSSFNGDLYHDGDIGLGTSTPNARIHILKPHIVNTQNKIWSDDYLNVQNSIYNGLFNPPLLETKFIIKSNGNVGINTETPSEKLHLNGRLRIQTSFGNVTMAAYNADFFHFITDLPRFYFNKQLTINGSISSYQTNDLIFQTNNNNNTRARIEHSTGDFVMLGGDIKVRGVNPLVSNFQRTLIHLKADGSSIFTDKVQIGLNSITSGNHNTSDVKLTVDGHAIFRKVIVTQSNWADFVFAEDYTLKPLEEVETFITENKHLPDVPSEKEVIENGISLGDMDAILLQKIEELTLYMIALEKKNASLEEAVNKLKTK